MTRAIRELLGAEMGEDPTPQIAALVAERNALKDREADVERLALGLFQTDPRVIAHVHNVGDIALLRGASLKIDSARWWRALFIAWASNERGWRDEALNRAAVMQFKWMFR